MGANRLIFMEKMTYIPSPVDTTEVVVPAELSRLSEMIARNAHEVWSATRLADGWTRGPVRDDTLRQHPGLIPYEELTEQEKEYDRRTSVETVRLILALGFEIIRKVK